LDFKNMKSHQLIFRMDFKKKLTSEKDIKSYPYLDITTHKKVGAKTLVWKKNENMVLEG